MDTLRTELFFNEEAELNTVGSMLIEPPLIPQILNIVNADDFVLLKNQLWFSQIAEQHRSGIVDVVVIKNHFLTDGTFKDAGGFDYLDTLLHFTISTANATHYAGIVKEKSNQRKLRQVQQDFFAVMNTPLTVNQKIEKIQGLANGFKIPKSKTAATIAESLKTRFEAVINGELESIPLPWRLASYLSNALLPGSLTLICGNPGASKSFMLLQSLAYWHNNGVKIACYELEEDRDFHLQRALAQQASLAGLTNLDWIKDNSDTVRETYGQYESFLDSFGVCLDVEPESQQTQQQIANWIRHKARQGCRVIAVDPITAAAHTGKDVWTADNTFLQDIKLTATNYGCSIVLITHPQKTVSFADMNSLAGSAAYARFSQSILWLESHEPKDRNVKTDCGTVPLEHNRTLHILKSRNGTGQGKRIAFDFDSKNLCLIELGLITK